jgi:putative CocE/NonD family hydrolase
MKKSILTIILLSMCFGMARSQDVDTETKKKDAMEVVRSTMVPMRDKITLSTDLYMPGGATEKLPAILIRTPYGKPTTSGWYKETIEALVARGYVVALQDMRGRYESEGRYDPSIGDRNDGYDTITWLTDQSWSNDKVGTLGCSYMGDVQVVLAATRHPKHAAASPMAPATGYLAYGRPWVSYDGGAFELAQTAGWFSSSGSRIVYGPPSWMDRQEWFRSEAASLFRSTPDRDSQAYLEFISTLPVIDILRKSGSPPTDYENFVSNNPDGPYFQEREWAHKSDRFDVPALFVDSWYDYGVAETLELFNLFQKNSVSERSRDNQFMIIAPSTHCGYYSATEHTIIGERDLGDARIDLFDIQLRWYDHWLKGIDNGVTDMPRLRYYLMGKNEWKSADAWPLPDTSYRKLHLHSGGRANSRHGDGALSAPAPGEDEPADRFVYDPATPVPSLGGQACCTGTEEGAGGYDQSTTEMRHDVLVYTSDPLEKGLEVTGPLEVVLYVASSAKDTDFTAKLVDVYPDGRAFNVQEGAQRMRYREGFSKNLRMKKGEVYEIHIDLHATSNYFGPGHRIRLEVSSSNFPRWDRNLNTGGNNYDETEWVTAKNTVHHSKRYPSHLVLPVID